MSEKRENQLRRKARHDCGLQVAFIDEIGDIPPGFFKKEVRNPARFSDRWEAKEERRKRNVVFD